jgi:hypothetical protein
LIAARALACSGGSPAFAALGRGERFRFDPFGGGAPRPDFAVRTVFVLDFLDRPDFADGRGDFAEA